MIEAVSERAARERAGRGVASVQNLSASARQEVGGAMSTWLDHVDYNILVNEKITARIRTLARNGKVTSSSTLGATLDVEPDASGSSFL